MSVIADSAVCEIPAAAPQSVALPTVLPTAPISPVRAIKSSLPPLEPGDHLSRDEFERRYLAMPQIKKAELIEGVVHMPSPVRWNQHGRQHLRLCHWMGNYEDATPGVAAGDNATIRLDLDNEPQPDATMIIEPNCGGQVVIDADGYVTGAPELVAEIAASTASFDLHTKFRIYRRAGVREYLVWRVLNQEVDWFVRRGSDFERLTPAANGCLKSEVFPGLWLSVPQLIAANYRAVSAVLQQGQQSDEHTAFAAKLEEAAKVEQGPNPQPPDS